MILVDSSVWVAHLRTNESALVELLNTGRVLSHPFVIGELACGNLKNRKAVLSLLQDLPAAPVATAEEALFFIESHGLMGRGIGPVDTHLLFGFSGGYRATLDAGQTSQRGRRVDAPGFRDRIILSLSSLPASGTRAQ